MKYSLRSLMIAGALVPLLIWVIWQSVNRGIIPTPAGSAPNRAIFQRVIREPYPTSNPSLRSAAENCFVVGAPASIYKDILTNADKVGPPDLCLPFTNTIPVGTQYVFWCEGKPPGPGRDEGDAYVVVITNGSPPTITHVWWDFLPK